METYKKVEALSTMVESASDIGILTTDDVAFINAQYKRVYSGANKTIFTAQHIKRIDVLYDRVMQAGADA